jgi:uncharacterized protein (DUF1800 family)
LSEGVLAAWRPRAGEWDRAAVLHLYRRAGFGARPAEVDAALADGLEATLARLFEDHTPPELRQTIQPLLASGEIELLQAWWMGLILAGGAPVRERMALVWHDLFATSNDKVEDVRLMHAQNELFRAQGLGDFRVLLRGLARDPAMLRWLDGDSNRRGQPNENFARELMELFALGIGHYDERDVQAAARAFSGFGTAGRAFVFRPEHHDDGEKTLFGRTGRFGGDEALELVLAHPACARHVARVLLEAFVAPAVEEPWIEALARVLKEADWNVEHALRVLLASRLFHGPAARRTRIAGPVELLAVAARALDAQVAPRTAARSAATMGQALFRPPSVKGWDGGRAWIHSGSWIARHNALVALVAERDGARADLATWLTGAREGWPGRVRQQLLPEAGPALDSALSAVAGQGDEEAARRACVALVLTSPEFQLF